MKCSSMAMTFMRARSSSIGLDAGAAQQAAEARQLLAHVGVELLRSHRHRLRAEVGEPLQHLRRLQRAGDLEVEPVDDRSRGLRGGEHADPEIELGGGQSEEHTSELQSLTNLVCRLLLEKKKNIQKLQRTSTIQI